MAQLQDALTFYVTGGTVPVDASSFVERAADRDLLTFLLGGEYCYVLNSRQMGKSSLSVRTIQWLRQEGIRTAFVDLTRIGAQNVTSDQWYAGLAFRDRPNTRFFGQPTKGIPTANKPFKLSDGAVLNLTVAMDADRTGGTYDSKIAPDEEIKPGWRHFGTSRDPVLRAAVKWFTKAGGHGYKNQRWRVVPQVNVSTLTQGSGGSEGRVNSQNPKEAIRIMMRRRTRLGSVSPWIRTALAQ